MGLHVHRIPPRFFATQPLEAHEDDLARTIMAEFSPQWSYLEDTHPRKLRNYGELHPRANEILGPQLQELIELVLTIDRAAH